MSEEVQSVKPAGRRMVIQRPPPYTATMAKNSSTEILKRWQAMDSSLGWEGLHVASFAKQWKVSIKTVRRDLKAFEAMGKETYCRLDDGQHRWRYQGSGWASLFADNWRDFIEQRHILGMPTNDVEWWYVGYLYRELRKKGMRLIDVIEAVKGKDPDAEDG